MRQIKTTLIVLLLFSSSILHAQRGIVITGISHIGIHGGISCSVGQIDYINIHNSNGALSAGLQQKIKTNYLNTVKIHSKNSPINVYPIPCSDYIYIELLENPFNEIVYSISDINGKGIISETKSKNEQKIDVSNLIPGIYFLSLYLDKSNPYQIKIIKF